MNFGAMIVNVSHLSNASLLFRLSADWLIILSIDEELLQQMLGPEGQLREDRW
jgi:hypothetical protein